VNYVKKQEERGCAFIIRPSKPLEIGRLEKNPEEVQKIYDIGRKDALEKIDVLKNWLSLKA
jgi:predicted patatin/cPLA2 family phospholipase